MILNNKGEKTGLPYKFCSMFKIISSFVSIGGQNLACELHSEGHNIPIISWSLTDIFMLKKGWLDESL